MQTAALDEGVPSAPVRDGSSAVKIAVIWAGVLALIGLLLIGFTLNRGFDWTDEGFVYTMIASNRVAAGEVWGFQHLLHPLFALFGESVLAFRVLRLIGYVLLSVVLVLAARNVAVRLGLRFSIWHWAFILLVAQIGTFAAWGYPPRYLGYNEVASWLAQVGCALLIVLLADVLVPARRGAWRTAALWFALGLLGATLGLIKISSGVIFGLLLLAALLVPTATFAWWKRAGSVVLGAVMITGVLGLLGYPLKSYLSSSLHLLTDRSAQEASDHSLAAIIPTYLASLEHTLALIVLPVALFVVVAFGLLRGRFAKTSQVEGLIGHERTLARGLWLLAILIAAAAFSIPGGNVWNDLGATIALLGAAGAAILVLVGDRLVRVPSTARHPRATLIVGAIVVALTPFVSAVGTNNTIFGQTLFSATTWAVLFGFAACALFAAAPRSVGARTIPLALAISMMAIFVGFVVTDVFVQPYRTVPYFQQQATIDSGPLRGLRVTPEEAELAAWLRDAEDNLHAAEVPAVAISAPGALLNFNRSGWANPWVDAMWPISFATVEIACEDGPPEDLLVLQPGSETSESASYGGFVAALDACGLDFPEDFTEVARTPGSMSDRQMTIWRLDRP